LLEAMTTGDNMMIQKTDLKNRGGWGVLRAI